MNLAQLLAERPVVLLDFDGPVCAVFGGELDAPEVARRLAGTARGLGIRLSEDIDTSDDPFDVLHGAARVGIYEAERVEPALRDAEVRAVATAPITPGLHEALTALRASGHTITVVSNNSDAAVRAFLTDHDLHDLIGHVVARTEPEPALLKPNPHLVTRAIVDNQAEPTRCVLIGDSTTDITAARQAGAAAIAYANKAGKRAILAAYTPDAIVDHLDDLTRAATVSAVS